MYKCTHFEIHELVPRHIYKLRGEKAWQLLDDRLLLTLDLLRERFGNMIVNNWKWGGDREWSGLRTPESPYYSPTSQHTFGRAADIIFKEVSAAAVRGEILRAVNDPIFNSIRSIEMDVSWLHFDVRNCSRILTYSP